MNTSRAAQPYLSKLTTEELEAFVLIERWETIAGFYRLEAGVLVGDETVHDAPDWSDSDRQRYIDRSRAVLRSGGTAFGVWDEDRLVGFALVDPDGVPSNPSLVQLDLFFVSAPCRGRGIARLLIDAVVELTRAHNADGVYISATPSRHTVDVYLHFGATVCDEPDPMLFGKEPDDIHLVLWLKDYRPGTVSERAG